MGIANRWRSFGGGRSARSDFDRLLPLLPELFRTALHYSGSEQEAEDLLHDLVLKLCRQPAQLDAVEVLLPWLRRSLYNLFIDHVRARQRSPLALVDPSAEPAELDRLVSDACGPEALAEQADEQRRISAALQRLRPEQRAVVVLHDIEGHALQDIAAMVEVPIGTVKSRLFRGRRQLLLLLDERNLAEPASVISEREAMK